jgi:hypothetical protein
VDAIFFFLFAAAAPLLPFLRHLVTFRPVGYDAPREIRMADAEKKGLFSEPNLALWDRILRAAVAAAIAIAWYLGYIPADIAVGLLIFAGLMLANGIFGKCGVYALLGFSTCKVKPQKKKKKA